MSLEYSQQEEDGATMFSTIETFLVAGYELGETDNDVPIVFMIVCYCWCFHGALPKPYNYG